MKAKRIALGVVVATVYIALPAYRYYVLGSWIAYKIMSDKPRPPRVVPKGSRLYEKITKGTLTP